jgi:hypothetical protein
MRISAFQNRRRFSEGDKRHFYVNLDPPLGKKTEHLLIKKGGLFSPPFSNLSQKNLDFADQIQARF